MSLNDEIDKKLEEDFDFGFSIMDEGELEAVQSIKQQSENKDHEVEKWKTVSMQLHAMITPFLDNLASQSEKSYIYWPNRVDKINAFKERLNSVIAQGTDE